MKNIDYSFLEYDWRIYHLRRARASSSMCSNFSFSNILTLRLSEEICPFKDLIVNKKDYGSVILSNHSHDEILFSIS